MRSLYVAGSEEIAKILHEVGEGVAHGRYGSRFAVGVVDQHAEVDAGPAVVRHDRAAAALEIDDERFVLAAAHRHNALYLTAHKDYDRLELMYRVGIEVAGSAGIDKAYAVPVNRLKLVRKSERTGREEGRSALLGDFYKFFRHLLLKR